jgi:glycosyltransferase involved in cell wall biosynthesis
MMGWVGAGHNVTLFSSYYLGSKQEEILDGIKIIRRGDQYFGVRLAGYSYWRKNKNNYDLVIDQFHGIPFFTPLYVKKPILAVLQEVAREVWFLNELPQPFKWVVGVLGYLLEPLIFVFYKKVPFMVGSNSAMTDLVEMGIAQNNITVVPHGVIIKKPEPLPEKEKISTVVFLGALTKDKGVEDALKAFAILDKNGRFQFWVIGKGSTEYQNYLKRLCRKLDIQDKVKFWGFVSQEEKFDLLARAHLLINPSVKEGWGLVNIEANAVGVPVVAYNTAGLIDSVKAGVNGLFSSSNTPQSLAEKGQKLLENRDLYSDLAKKAIGWSSQFSWQSSIKKSLTLIVGII